MNITKTYRGKTSIVKNVNLKPWRLGVKYESHCGKGAVYSLQIPISDYLPVARRLCQGLSEVSGVQYQIMAKHPDGNHWRAL